MRLVHVWADAGGETHVRDALVPLREGDGSAGAIGALSGLVPATGVRFRRTPADYAFDWHCAPARQFIICLDAGAHVTTSDGAEREVRAGDVLFVEDVAPCKGHKTRAVGGQARHSMFITVPDDVRFEDFAVVAA